MLTPIRKIADLDTEKQISFMKQHFLQALSTALQLHQVFAPLYVTAESGINDDLNSIERPVSFSTGGSGRCFSIVHSLAKWKRLRLAELGIPAYEGIVTHMIALRPDEVLSPLHSILVDQWDWEVVIRAEDRNTAFLERAVYLIYRGDLQYATGLTGGLSRCRRHLAPGARLYPCRSAAGTLSR